MSRIRKSCMSARLAAATLLTFAAAAPASQAQSVPPLAAKLTLRSPAFRDGAMIPAPYTRDTNLPVSPGLVWSDPPAGVASYAIVVTDISSFNPKRTHEGILHWMLFNIPGTAAAIPENLPALQVLKDGTVQGRNFRQNVGYLPVGAPTSGPPHHYAFELYALDTLLDLGPEAKRGELMAAMQGHVIGKAAMFGRFRMSGNP